MSGQHQVGPVGRPGPAEVGLGGRTLVPPPRGPNVGLLFTSLVLLGISIAVCWTALGLPSIELARLGPGALVVAGLVLVLAGQVGLLRRRRRRR